VNDDDDDDDDDDEAGNDRGSEDESEGGGTMSEKGILHATQRWKLSSPRWKRAITDRVCSHPVPASERNVPLGQVIWSPMHVYEEFA